MASLVIDSVFTVYTGALQRRLDDKAEIKRKYELLLKIYEEVSLVDFPVAKYTRIG